MGTNGRQELQGGLPQSGLLQPIFVIETQQTGMEIRMGNGI